MISGQRFATITWQYAINDGHCHTSLWFWSKGRVQYTRLAKGLDRRNVQYQDDETRETLDDNEIEL